MNDNKVIYHYCSIETFMAIIENKSIRLCDLNKTNDYMEMKWAIKYAVTALKEQILQYGISMNLTEDYWYAEVIKNHLEYFNNEIRMTFNNRPILIICFSEDKDLLSQWRAYGQDGEGIAIGFNYDKLKVLNNNKNNQQYSLKNIEVKKIIYNENQQKSLVGNIISKCIAHINDMFEREKEYRAYDKFDEYFIGEFDAFCEVFVDELKDISYIIKNPAFKEEKEIRIIYDPELPRHIDYGDLDKGELEKFFESERAKNGFIINPIKYTRKGNQLVAYSDLNFSKFISNNIIEAITIGPKCKISEDDIYYYLLSNGYNAENIHINYSNATYR